MFEEGPLRRRTVELMGSMAGTTKQVYSGYRSTLYGVYKVLGLGVPCRGPS